MKIVWKLMICLTLILIIVLSVYRFGSTIFHIATINDRNIGVTLCLSIVCFLVGFELLFNFEGFKEIVFHLSNRSKTNLLGLWVKSLDPRYELIYQIGGGVIILISFYLFGVFVSDLFLFIS